MAYYAPSIRSLFFLAILVAIVNAAVHVGRHDGGDYNSGHHSHHPRPSHTQGSCTPSSTPPANCYTCPGADSLGFTVGSTSDSNGALFCSYPAVPGEDPNDFFCNYSDTTGALTDDNDAGLCPTTAVSGPCNVPIKRETIVEALKRRAQERAAQPQTSRPRFMTSRSNLGKKRRS